ncbi:serine/threonine-protein kinase RIO3-like [Saccoglossus kowalevskii]|uniref:Serine/threonine-protein kinase RIO3 n=1 Tax=Saccoglossus kowalevskii TaxID=10224 RepID=A0ABM0GSA2_SACKO|nr:PREDICTED: serine/threonine-protein kinase RIO3-like [Saccoglossus kowalevskii]
MESRGEVLVSESSIPNRNPWTRNQTDSHMPGVVIGASPSPPSPWKSVVQVTAEPCSLSDVMSEELAKELQKKEEKDSVISTVKTGDTVDFDLSLFHEDGKETDNDLLLAQMLQLEFDKEHDQMLKNEEQHFNKDSKVKLSFANYRSVHPALNEDVDEDDSWDEDEDTVKGNASSMPKKGYRGKGKDIKTKHDAATCGRKNASKMENFAIDFATGNCSQIDDLQLSNSVYNVLKKHSHSEEKKSHRVHEKKEHSTTDHAMDTNTRLILYKLVNNGTLETINGTISTGKEAVIIHADGGMMEGKLVPYECAIKVFKTTLNEFKSRDKYIKDDYRFKDRLRKLNPRKIIRMWAEKEMHNLMRMQKIGIRVPEVVLLRKHVLVMSFIGKDAKPAPKIKYADLTLEDTKDAYQQCIKMMKLMFVECKLIHADLSEYNMLWHNNLLWFIDVSQSVEPNHPCGLEFLFRDCTNVSTFFSKCGVPGVMKPHELFNYVSQLNLPPREGKDFLLQIQAYENSEEFRTKMGIMVEKNYAFDYYFEQSLHNESDEEEDND